jgi:hypothetical protein
MTGPLPGMEPAGQVVKEDTGIQEHPIDFIGKFGGNYHFNKQL